MPTALYLPPHTSHKCICLLQTAASPIRYRLTHPSKSTVLI